MAPLSYLDVTHWLPQAALHCSIELHHECPQRTLEANEDTPNIDREGIMMRCMTHA
jgi:hypothetical protein